MKKTPIGNQDIEMFVDIESLVLIQLRECA